MPGCGGDHRGVSVLLLAAVSTGLVGVVYAWVGHRLRRRKVQSAGARAALDAFALWWTVMAANQLLWMLVNAHGALVGPDFALQMTYGVVQRVLLAVSLAGLLAYLLFVLTGRMRVPLVATYYALYLAVSLYSFNWGHPVALHEGAWRVDLDFARRPPPAVELLMFALLIGPPVVACLAYGAQVRRAPRGAPRMRLLATSVGLVVWWVLAVVAGAPRTLDLAWLQAVNRVVGLLVAFAILLAYAPTAWMERSLGLSSDERTAS